MEQKQALKLGLVSQGSNMETTAVGEFVAISIDRSNPYQECVRAINFLRSGCKGVQFIFYATDGKEVEELFDFITRYIYAAEVEGHEVFNFTKNSNFGKRVEVSIVTVTRTVTKKTVKPYRDREKLDHP